MSDIVLPLILGEAKNPIQRTDAHKASLTVKIRHSERSEESRRTQSDKKVIKVKTHHKSVPKPKMRNFSAKTHFSDP